MMANTVNCFEERLDQCSRETENNGTVETGGSSVVQYLMSLLAKKPCRMRGQSCGHLYSKQGLEASQVWVTSSMTHVCASVTH